MSQQSLRLSYFSVAINMLTGGRAYAGDDHSSAGFLKLTTTGRKSGQQRTVTLLYLRDGPSYVLTASNGGSARNPGWYYNLVANPRATLDVHGKSLVALAEVAGPEKRRELWARLTQIASMYEGYEKRTAREIPMVILSPLAESEPDARA